MKRKLYILYFNVIKNGIKLTQKGFFTAITKNELINNINNFCKWDNCIFISIEKIIYIIE